MRKLLIPIFLISLVVSGCGNSEETVDSVASIEPQAINIDPIATYLPSANELANIDLTPTPDDLISFFPTFTPFAPEQPQTAANFPTPTPEVQGYEVRSGDYWLSIANAHNISVEDLLAANNMSEFDIIYPGDILKIPDDAQIIHEVVPESVEFSYSNYYKIIPDSELVYSPSAAKFDTLGFIAEKGGYLSTYNEEIDGESMTGAQIVQIVAKNYSVNPRILLAILEHRSSWVTRADPGSAAISDAFLLGRSDLDTFYKQLQVVANTLNFGFYSWLTKENTIIQLSDGSYWKPSLGDNAGTAGVLRFYAMVSDPTEWKLAGSENGVAATYRSLFGNPFQYAVEPLAPNPASQPKLDLPFASGEGWYFTGGPHGGWDDGSAAAAIDFAPPEEYLGCEVSEHWATAVAKGNVIRSENGVVVLDLDGDGYEQTGWVIFYLHMAEDGAAKVGPIEVGEKIGHPSCEGGISYASHVHIARKYNGLWISATDESNPYVLGTYKVIASGKNYDGYLQSGSQNIEAFDGYSDINLIEW